MKAITNAVLAAHRHPRILICCKSFSLILLFLVTGTFASAQLRALNEDGSEPKAQICKRFVPLTKAATLNVFGFNQVQAGNTYYYWVQPSDPNNPGNPYTPIWNDEGFLDDKGIVTSSWSDPTNGREWCTVAFLTPGWCFLTYYGPYNGYMDWGELSIEVIP